MLDKYVFIESYSRKILDCMDHNAHQTWYVLGRMQYAPTYTV